MGEHRLFRRRLDLRINQDISEIERNMAIQLQLAADEQAIGLIRAILKGDNPEIPSRDHHAHINLTPELEI